MNPIQRVCFKEPMFSSIHDQYLIDWDGELITLPNHNRYLQGTRSGRDSNGEWVVINKRKRDMLEKRTDKILNKWVQQLLKAVNPIKNY